MKNNRILNRIKQEIFNDSIKENIIQNYISPEPCIIFLITFIILTLIPNYHVNVLLSTFITNIRCLKGKVAEEARRKFVH